jgi:D-alanyl-D-alanine carboxypeptidase
MEQTLATGTVRRRDEARSGIQGPHVATVIFLVFMLSAAAVGVAQRMASDDDGGGNQALALTAEATESTAPGDPEQELASTSGFSELASIEDTAPQVTAQSVYAVDLETGEVLLSRGAEDERDIGSTVKIMTALVVVDHANLDDEVVIEESDLVDPLVYSNMALTAGDTLTVEQLLTGLLVPSGSDGALALARYVGGLIDPDADDPRAIFAAAMNEKADELGMEHSQFSNPDGNDAGDQYSSARDLALASAALLANPVLADMVALPGYSFVSVGPEQREYAATSTNKLLVDGFPGVTGVKTGSTEDAGGCVVLAQIHPVTGHTILVSVLGADLTYVDGWIETDARWDDATALLTWIDEQAL